MFNKSSFKSNSISLITLALPLFIELLLNNLLSSIDTIMIAKYNESYVSAISNAQSVLALLIVLFAISGTGISIVVSQYLGAKKKEADQVLGQGIIINLIIALIITFFFIFGNKLLLRLIKTPEEILEASSKYIFIVSFSLPFQSLTTCLSCNLKSHKKPFSVTIIYLVTNGLNALLNYLLIFGKLGLPELGYVGAAIATLTCHIITFIAALIVTKIQLKQRIFYYHIDKEIMSHIIKIGLPSAFENICYNISQIIILAQVNKLLIDSVTARSYVNLFLTYIFMFSSSLGSANAILVGHSVGEKDYIKARHTTGIASFYAYPIIFIIVTIINIFGKNIFPLLTNNPNVLQAIYETLPFIFVVELGRCANLIYINALKSTGDTLFPVLAAIFSMFLVADLLAFIFTQVLHLGLKGVYLAMGLDEVLRAILCYIRWKSNVWTKKGLINSVDSIID